MDKNQTQESMTLQSALDTLIAKGKKDGTVSSKAVIDMLDAIDATPEQAEQIYNTLESAGIEIDVGDILDLLQNSNLEEPEPSESEIQKIEAEKVEDPSVLADSRHWEIWSACISRKSAKYRSSQLRRRRYSVNRSMPVRRLRRSWKHFRRMPRRIPAGNWSRRLPAASRPSSGWLSPTCGWSSPLPNATLAAVCSCWIWCRRAIWGS